MKTSRVIDALFAPAHDLGRDQEIASAFSTHSWVSGFIQNFAFGQNLLHKTIAPSYSPGDEFWRTDDKVKWKISRDALADLKRFAASLAVERHNDKNIHIGISRGLSL